VITLEHEFPVVVLTRRFTVAELQLSDAVGAVNDGVAVHSIVVFAPAAPITGGVTSTTFTGKVQGALLHPFNVVTSVSV
jgi:hypothetical protein